MRQAAGASEHPYVAAERVFRGPVIRVVTRGLDVVTRFSCIQLRGEVLPDSRNHHDLGRRPSRQQPDDLARDLELGQLVTTDQRRQRDPQPSNHFAKCSQAWREFIVFQPPYRIGSQPGARGQFLLCEPPGLSQALDVGPKAVVGIACGLFVGVAVVCQD